MRKFQKSVLATLLVVVIAQSIQASPRSRRRARRSRQNSSSTVRTNSSNNNVVRSSTSYQSIKPRHSARPTADSRYLVQPAPSAYPLVTSTTTSPPAAVSPSQATPQRQTLSETRTLDAGDQLPVDPTVGESEIAQASYETPVSVSTATTILPATYTVAQPQAFYQANNVASSGSPIAEVNAIRARRGLFPFIEDRALSGVAYRKASIQANRGAMGHPGGSMGGARYEGVGMGARFTSCYLFSSGGRYAGAASVRSSNGQRYHCLLVK